MGVSSGVLEPKSAQGLGERGAGPHARGAAVLGTRPGKSDGAGTQRPLSCATPAQRRAEAQISPPRRPLAAAPPPAPGVRRPRANQREERRLERPEGGAGPGRRGRGGELDWVVRVGGARRRGLCLVLDAHARWFGGREGARGRSREGRGSERWGWRKGRVGVGGRGDEGKGRGKGGERRGF